MKRISIFLFVFLMVSLSNQAAADKTIFQYRDRGIEITVKLIEESNEPPINEPNEPVEPNEPNEPNEPSEPNEPIEPNQPIPMRWVSPISVEDPNNGWSGESKIFDGDPNTYAVAAKKVTPFILFLKEPADSNACRLFMHSVSRFWRIDIFYENAWHSIFEGTIVPGWYEIPYQKKSVSKARIFQTGGSANGSISEFEFFAAIPEPAESPPGEIIEPNEPNEPIEISSNIKYLETQGQLYSNVAGRIESQRQSMIAWWDNRYRNGWEKGNAPPLFIRAELEEKYGQKFWEN